MAEDNKAEDNKLPSIDIDALADECVKRILANDHQWDSVIGSLRYQLAAKVIGLAIGKLVLIAVENGRSGK